MEFSRQECWSGKPLPSPGYRLDSGIGPGSPALQADSLPPNPPEKSIQWEENKINIFVLWADFVEMRVLSSNFRVSSSFRRKGKVSSVGRKGDKEWVTWLNRKECFKYYGEGRVIIGSVWKSGKYTGLGTWRLQSRSISKNNCRKVADKMELAGRGKVWKYDFKFIISLCWIT